MTTTNSQQAETASKAAPRGGWVALTLLALLLAVACGEATPQRGDDDDDGGSGGSGSTGSTGGNVNPNAAKCALACESMLVTCPDVSASCAAACETVTLGLAPTCAQCVIDNSGLYGTFCPNDPECCASSFGPSGTHVGCGTSCSCSPEEESCDGFSIAKPTDSECAEFCQ